MYTAGGMASGTIVNCIYSQFSKGVLFHNTIVLRSLTCFGVAYLIYIVFKGFTRKAQNIAIENLPTQHKILKGEAFVSGVVAHILDPGIQCYLSSILTTAVLSSYAPNLAYLIYPIILFLQTFAWYWVIAMLLSEYIKILCTKVIPIEPWINRITGGIVVAIAVRLLFL